MPLYKSITINNDTRLLIWKNTESLEEFFEQVKLKDTCSARIDGMKSELHKKGFLGVRMLLQEIGYTDFDLFYDNDGKPHLTDGMNISITHSYAFSAIIISKNDIGIDMELQREKVITIADKFIEPEFAYLDPTQLSDYMHKLIVIWGVKEAVYKMISRAGLSFKQNIYVFPFDLPEKRGMASVKYEEINESYPFFFEEIEDFILVYCLGSKTLI
ncbi:4'-phosphopantetheinyl transferase superfamily protein [Flavobacterium sp. DG1-102-2]|uniref:4'-phosphopantetheinyl transferase family protein n=1 Tax=Flavobacterium sp. DG1-102-2 TaxID=3081663 RepID=UPI002948D3F4|nr:4'-phosphopantetheinyl transferase superfamily protein [Flavobacterium sp. DG1-102-2]MDV6169011.1 4'-phosphopantetheinyl transferase superfamily protein [Flavobacterium sp. DG1-102-2]